MMKKGLLLLLLSMTLSSAASCHAAEAEAGEGSGLEESRAESSRVYSYDYALSDEEIAEQYADLSAKLYPYGKENAEQTISAEGLAYFTEIRDRYLEEYGDGDEEVIRMYDFMLDERQFFPAADGGLFAVYGYRMLGATWPTYYDVFFLSASEETLIYTGPQAQIDTDFLGNGEKLMIFSITDSSCPTVFSAATVNQRGLISMNVKLSSPPKGNKRELPFPSYFFMTVKEFWNKFP